MKRNCIPISFYFIAWIQMAIIATDLTVYQSNSNATYSLAGPDN